jgi:hypothetical protein
MREKQEESGWREMSIGVGEIETPKSRDLFLCHMSKEVT